MRKPSVLPLLIVAFPSVALAEPEPMLNLSLGGESVPFVRIAPGRFVMGSPKTEAMRNEDELEHPVSLSTGFYMAKTPVTVKLWKRFVDATGYRSEAEKGTSGGSGWDGRALVQKPEYNWRNPGFPQTDEHPVTIITYDDALAFTQWATQATKRNVSLPTEAQWEYAYRAGTTTTFYDAKAKDALAIGWFKENAGQGTKPVGTQKPNPWGLFDMAGNVWQWCLDWYAPYPESEVTDPLQTVADTSDKARRVLRGGSWLKDAKNGRAAARNRNTPGSRNADNGFRLVVLDAPPVLAAPAKPSPDRGNASQPSQSTPSAPNAPDAPEESSNWFRVVTAIPVIGFFAWVLSKILGCGRKGAPKGGSSGGIRLEPAKDGFWVYAGPQDVGSRITVKYQAVTGERTSYVTVERADQGQFMYTGYAPQALVITEVIPAAQRSGRNRSQTSSYRSDDDDDSNSSSSSFQGYPSAY